MPIDELIRSSIRSIAGPDADPTERLADVIRRRGRRRRARRMKLTVVAVFVVAGSVGTFFGLSEAFRAQRASTPSTPALSRNGLVVFAAKTSAGHTALFTVRSDGSQFHPFATASFDSPGGYVDSPRWSPDGAALAYVKADGIWIAGTTPGQLPPLPRRITNGMHVGSLAWSPDGSRIVFSGSPLADDSATQQLYVVRSNGTDLTQLTHARDSIFDPDWSPDGSTIAYHLDYQVWVVGADGSHPKALTNFIAGASDPDWSPDGTKILFDYGLRQISVMNADGTGVAQLTHGPIHYWNPSWSPDGTKIVAEGQPNGGPQNHHEVYVMDAEGSDPVAITDLASLGVSQTGLSIDWQPLEVAATTTVAGCSSEAPCRPPQTIQEAMTQQAQAGLFQEPPAGGRYVTPVTCHVDRPGAFHGADVYLCAISIEGPPGVSGHLWEWGAFVGGKLHTHAADPVLIPTITGPWDPPWLPPSP